MSFCFSIFIHLLCFSIFIASSLFFNLHPSSLFFNLHQHLFRLFLSLFFCILFINVKSSSSLSSFIVFSSSSSVNFILHLLHQLSVVVYRNLVFFFSSSHLIKVQGFWVTSNTGRLFEIWMVNETTSSMTDIEAPAAPSLDDESKPVGGYLKRAAEEKERKKQEREAAEAANKDQCLGVGRQFLPSFEVLEKEGVPQQLLNKALQNNDAYQQQHQQQHQLEEAVASSKSVPDIVEPQPQPQPHEENGEQQEQQQKQRRPRQPSPQREDDGRRNPKSSASSSKLVVEKQRSHKKIGDVEERNSKSTSAIGGDSQTRSRSQSSSALGSGSQSSRPRSGSSISNLNRKKRTLDFCGFALPVEVMWRIMGLLSVRDLGNFALVCKRWAKLTFDTSFFTITGMLSLLSTLLKSRLDFVFFSSLPFPCSFLSFFFFCFSSFLVLFLLSCASCSLKPREQREAMAELKWS